MKPIIGITSSNTKNQYTQIVSLNQEYVQAIQLAGGIPIILPSVENLEDAIQCISHVDGILFSGGGDIAPYVYGAEPSKWINEMDYKRDVAELFLFEASYSSNLPILGICRGMQLINVACGGTLFQDLHQETDTTLGHSPSSVPRNQLFHSVQIKEGSFLEQIMGGTEVLVNSHHHQSLDAVSKNFEVVANAKDGIIEAIWDREKDFVVGVQWHPEMLVSSYPNFLKIFRSFIFACSPDLD